MKDESQVRRKRRRRPSPLDDLPPAEGFSPSPRRFEPPEPLLAEAEHRPIAESPPKPANVFRAIVDPQPQAIVLTCSDPRFQSAFRQFIEERLGLAQGQYIPFTVAGSGGAMGRPDALPKEFKFMRDRFEMLLARYPTPRRLIVVNHEDCAYYRELSQKAAGLVKPFHVHLPREDMPRIAAVFPRLLSHLGMQLEMYYARYVEGELAKIAIERIE
jgi:hypothetical protein